MWSAPRAELKISCESIEWQKMISQNERREKLEKCGYSCRFCGGKYEIGMIHFDGDFCCPLCYNMTHLGGGKFGGFIVGISDMSQVDIVRKSVDFVIENGVVPFLSEVDEAGMLAPLSTLEFVHVVAREGGVPEWIEKYKLFLSQTSDESPCGRATPRPRKIGVSPSASVRRSHV